jgi:hypothetical protein
MGEAVASQATTHATCSSHRRYWLTCDQYERLVQACGDCCQICRRPAAECRPHQKLYIDHDQHYGVWAVRGLLCPRCNSLLISDRPDPEWAFDYLATPWFRRAYAEMGVSVEHLLEPPVGSYFNSPKGTSWVREDDCWQNESFARGRRDWARLCREFSPLQLREIHVPRSNSEEGLA